MDNTQAKIFLGKELARKLIRMSGTYREIAQSLGTSTSTVSNIINGYYERMSIRMYMRLADQVQLEVSVEVTDLE